MKKIAVVGIGIMGTGIASNFLKDGYQVVVWNRSKNKLHELIAKGASTAKSPKEAAEKADIIFEVTANDKSSEEVWTSEKGILKGASPQKVLITCATLSVNWVDKLADICKTSGFTFFDMPMTGSRKGAETGTMTLLVGGSSKKLKEIENDLKAISAEVWYFGKVGSGMRFKLLLNMLQSIYVVALGEALKIAKNIGLDVKKVGDALAQKPGGSTTQVGWAGYQKEPNPVNFSLEWMTKDLKYAKELAEGIDTPFLNKTLSKYKKAVKDKMGNKDWTLVSKL